MTPYVTYIDTFSLSRTVFEIFDFKVFRVWPLTSKGHLGLVYLGLKVIWGRKVFYHSKGHIWLLIWLLYTPSLYLVPFSRYKGLTLTFDPKRSSGVEFFIPLDESSYMTSYLTPIDTIYLYRTVLEIMLVKILKAKQNGGFWPFTGQGQKSICFYHIKGTSSHQTASLETLCIKIGSAV